jgi:hypothetical protein
MEPTQLTFESDLIRALIPLEESCRRLRKQAMILASRPHMLRVALMVMNEAEALSLSAAIAASRARSFAKDSVRQRKGEDSA